MKLGYIGLGRMGKNMVLHLLDQGQEVVAWNRSPEPREEVKAAGAEVTETVEELIKILKQVQDDKGIVLWLMLPAGEITDQFIDEVLPLLEPGDLLIDGANSFYKDTLRRAEEIKPTGVHFMDIGVSGGPAGARSGACLMIGGAKEDFERIKDLVIKIAAPDAWGHFGEIGAGHYAKMVHNGIEYGMMEAIGEGAAVLKAAPFKLDLVDIFRVYNKRSVIESCLVEWTYEALTEDPELSQISSEIKASGEGEWTINTAKELGVDVPVIEDSLNIRKNSINDQEDSPNGFRNKVVSAQRGKFGQHAVKKG